MNEPASGQRAGDPGRTGGTLYKKDFWRAENLKYSRPHLRMEKVSQIVNKLAGDRDCTLLDVGCGPATLQTLLRPNVQYNGIDIAIQAPAPNLLEADIIEAPISFGGRTFDIVVAQGFFEYVGEHQSRKFAEIARLLNPGGVFIASYVNFDHRHPEVYWPYSNVLAFSDFSRSLGEHFTIRRCFPTSYNWNHWEPSQKLVRAVNMRINMNIPLVGPVLAVQYLVLCTPHAARAGESADD